MDRQEAIETLDGILKWYHGFSKDLKIGEKQIEAFEMAIADMHSMQYLTGRPCEVCSCHNEKGCGVWECVFDKKENV